VDEATSFGYLAAAIFRLCMLSYTGKHPCIIGLHPQHTTWATTHWWHVHLLLLGHLLQTWPI
jgi:hypothetical protein